MGWLPFGGEQQYDVKLIGGLQRARHLQRREVLDPYYRQRLLDVAEEGAREFIRSRPGSENACVWIAERELIRRELVEDDIVAIQQGVLRSNAIRRRDEQLGYECHTRKRKPPCPLPNSPMQRGKAQQDHERNNRKHVTRQHCASRKRERCDIREN